MLTLRLAIVISLLSAFTVIAMEGSGLCPHGGRGRASVSSDQGSGTDPDGVVSKSAVNGDKGLGVDPNG